MGSWGAVVSTGGARNCFIKIPASWAPKLDRNKLQVFQLRAPTGETLYTTWQGDVSDRRDSDIIEISGLYATKQGINDGTQVVVTKVDSVIFCECLFVEPLSVDDWEILELHAQWVEQHLLDQVRVVWSGQVLPLWVGGNICIFVKVESVEPAASCCLLEPTTELHIAPKDRRRPPPPASQPAREKATRPHPSPDHGQGAPHSTVTSATGPAHKSNQADARQLSASATPTNIEETAPSSEVENPDFLHWVIGYFQTLLFGVRAPAVEAGRGSPQGALSMYTYKKELLPGSSVCTVPLRVQACGELYAGTPGCPSLGLASEHGLSDVSPVDIGHQPSCVYVNLQSYCDLLSHRHRPTHPQLVPRTFLAALKPSKTPTEREEAITKTMLNKKPAGIETNGSGSDALPEDPSPEACSVVRVVLVDRDNAFTLRAPGGQTIAQVRFSLSKGPLPGHVMISDLLRRQMSLQSTSIACLQPLVDSEGTGAGPADVTGITLHPLFTVPQSFSEEMIVMAFKAWIREVTCLDYPLVVSNGTLIKLFLKQDLDGEFLVTLDRAVAANAPSVPTYCLLQLGACEDLTVKVAPRMTAVNRPPTVRRLPCWNLAESDPQLPAVSLQQLGGVKELYAEMSSYLATSLAHRPLDAQLMAAHCGQRAGMLLLTGAKGSGKSALARAVCRALGEPPTSAHVTVIGCKPLRGKRADTIQKQFHKAFTEAAWRQPAVLLLDDLDQVTAAPAGPEQEMSGEAVYYARIAEVLKDLLHREVVERSAVVVVATCRSQKSLHPTLTSSRGHHLCQKAVHISPPDKAQREAMLEALLTFRSGLSVEAVQGLDLTRVAGQTEGYVVRDLEQVVDRALHARRMARNNKDSGRTRPLSDSDFITALKGFTPMGLRHVTLQDSGDVTWSHVGGLHAVRRALIETLQWPSKYPALFASCPLRLRAGLLLYGAPGTGKTLLAAAVAKECGLNFISIKGPELLSKYIGASEQAVRETFERAQSAKPCILFFDEFDSLAPRRGHDNTGVTDRVVNQLLTQLDGVEGLEGVYVLAATSRPDLIDPALLRPGRLDKALHCTLPSKEERVEILEALSRHMSLADDVDLHQVASQCSYFTGADLKALLYNAQLAAIHQTTDLWAGLRNASTDTTDRAMASLDSPGLDATQQKPGVNTRGRSGLESRTSFEYLLPENGSHEEGTRERNHSSVSEGSSGSDLSVGQSHSWEVVPIDPEKSKEKTAEKVGAEKAAKETAAVELKVEPTESRPVEPVGRSMVEPPAGSRLVAYLPRLEDGVLTLTPREQQDILNKYPETTEKSETTVGHTPVISSLSQRHLMEAARTMQPSVSESERRKFERIYDQFVASKGGGGFSGSMSEVGQRATLA